MNTIPRRNKSTALRAVGLAALTAALGLPVQAGTTEDMMTVTDTQQRARMQGVRSDRRLTETRSVLVNFADLDLSRQAGVDALYTRLESASKTACGTRDLRIAKLRRDWDACYVEALDNAVATVGIERVVAEHRAQTGRDLSGRTELAGAPQAIP